MVDMILVLPLFSSSPSFSPYPGGQIAHHLTPQELLSLARATKRLRTLLMSKESKQIWRAAEIAVGLPECPDINSPHLATFLLYVCGFEPTKAFHSPSFVRYVLRTNPSGTSRLAELTSIWIHTLFLALCVLVTEHADSSSPYVHRHPASHEPA